MKLVLCPCPVGFRFASLFSWICKIFSFSNCIINCIYVLDIVVDVDSLTDEQKEKFNQGATVYGMKPGDYIK